MRAACEKIYLRSDFSFLFCQNSELTFVPNPTIIILISLQFHQKKTHINYTDTLLYEKDKKHHRINKYLNKQLLHI